MTRIENSTLRERVTTAKAAAKHINHLDNVGMSGFTGAGGPKLVPTALAERAGVLHARGEEFQIGLWTGASTSPDVDGVLARARAIAKRLPYNSDPDLRSQINAGEVDYIEPHLSHSAQQMRFGFYGKLDIAVVEVVSILPDGRLVPSSSVGNNKAWLDEAQKVILEVNSWQPRELEGFHDIYQFMGKPPDRQPIGLTQPMQRLGDPYLRVDLDKVVAVVETHAPDTGTIFTAPDENQKRSRNMCWNSSRLKLRSGACLLNCCQFNPALEMWRTRCCMGCETVVIAD